MFRSIRPLAITFGLGAAFCLGFAVRAHGQDDGTFDLITYRTALEQLSAGKAQNAQILLEGAQRGGPLAPESALLLAYLQDNSGQGDAARRTLQTIDSPSPLTSAYLRRLGVQTPDTVDLKTGASKNPARLAATDARLTKLESYMVELVNADRAKNGLPALESDSRLAEVARAHSAEMRDKSYFAHESPTSGLREPKDRYDAGYGGRWRVVAENIYRAYGGHSYISQADTRDAEAAFMKSPGHRANILNPDVNRIGIGFCTNGSGDVWITQMFCLRD